jgi:hypothetical protein
VNLGGEILLALSFGLLFVLLSYPWQLLYRPMGQFLGHMGVRGYVGYDGPTCILIPPVELAAGWLGCIAAAALLLWGFQNLRDRLTR